MIRKVSVNDYNDIRKICVEDLGYECKEELVKTRIEHLDENREMVFVAEIDNVIVGYIHIEKYNLLYFENMANILGLAVAKKYQKQGWGRKLMEAAEQWSKDHNIYIIRLNSGIGRKEAHKFYRAIGFSDEKEQMRFIKQL